MDFKEWLDLDSLKAVLPDKCIQASKDLWETIRASFPSIPEPQAGPTAEGDMLEMVWDREEHHFDVDINADGTFDWFYCCRHTADSAVGGQDLETFLQRLNLVYRV